MTPEPPMAVRWGQDAASVGHPSPGTTASAVRAVTTATHNASVSQSTTSNDCFRLLSVSSSTNE